MTDKIIKTRGTQLNRICREIRKSGPISFTKAREVMTSGRSKGRDVRMWNRAIQEFIRDGKLSKSWDAEGNTLIGL